jgi:arginyl-tRNA synthetase
MLSSYGQIREELYAALSDAMEECYYDSSLLTNTIDFARAVGDISCSVAFKVAKTKPGSPNDIARSIAEKLLKNPRIQKFSIDNGYINFYLNRAKFTKDTVDYIFDADPAKPISSIGTNEKVIIEYPSANPAHPLHVGQLRNAILGDSISNLHMACGYRLEKEDYIDDLGLQAAQALWGSMNRDKLNLPFDPKKKFDHALGEAYVAAYKYITDNKLDDQIKELMALMDQDGTYESDLARKQAEQYITAERETLFAYGIYHDLLVWESDVLHDKLLEKCLAALEKLRITDRPVDGKYAGCIIIDLNKLGNLPQEFKGLREEAKVLVRANGVPNYLAKDIAFHMWKFGILESTFKFSEFIHAQPDGRTLYTTGREGERMKFGNAKKAVNTIDARQSAEQAMVKVILDAMGRHEAAKGFNHLAYGVVELEGGASLAGRKGTWVGYTADDLLREATEKAMSLIGDRFKLQEKEKEDTARKVALGAIKFEFLRFSPEKNITFSWGKALNFQGDSGPYCQYTYARALRLLEDSGIKGKGFDPEHITTDPEFALVKQLSRLTEIVEKACNELRPNVVTDYCIDLSYAFSNFYEQLPILKAPDEKQREGRLALTLAFANALKYSLGLLGIPVASKM